jgi:chorismate synthase
VIPALSVIAEAVAAWEVLRVFLEKFGGDTIADTMSTYEAYVARVSKRLKK